ncbi:MAG TPA: ABC transporter permease [Clostridia bacterium]|nr:ABC transporter permease [Clostridia bacterium]
MFKLMQYELKGRYKYYIGVLIGILSLFLYINLRLPSITNEGIILFTIVTTYILFIAIAMTSNVIFYSTDLFGNVFGNTGYLLFTLPLKGKKILGSKIILSILEFILFLISFTFLWYLTLLTHNSLQLFMPVISTHKTLLMTVTMLVIVYYSFLIITAYFSMVLAKTIFYVKKYGILFFVFLFGVSYFITNKLYIFLSKLFPYYIDITGTSLTFTKIVEINPTTSISFNITNLNIAVIIFQILIIVTLFFTTSYLIDNKMNL